jgi:hypothetical protein
MIVMAGAAPFGVWKGAVLPALNMRNKLVRIYGQGHLHFVTSFECRGAAMSLSRRGAAAERTLLAKTKATVFPVRRIN